MSNAHALSLFFAALVLVNAAGIAMLPRVGPRDLWFAVSVEPSFRDGPVARAIRTAFWRAVAWSSLLALFVVALGAVRGSIWLGSLGLQVQLIGAAIAAARANRRTRPHAAAPSTVREAELVPRRTRTPGGLLQIGPFAILGATAIALAARWDALPARVVTHRDALGRADGWSPKSIGSVFGGVIAMGALALFLMLLALLVERMRRTAVSGPRGASEQRVREAGVEVVVAAEYLVAILGGLITLPTLGAPGWIVVFGFPLAFAYIIGMLIRLVSASGGSGSTGSGPGAGGDGTPDAAWRLGGLVYFNRDDPALLVAKRLGFGTTFNMARPTAQVVAGLLVIGMVVSLVLAARA